jgi:DNA-directed RNA polymerase specialized sigma subunit|tara:strand:+ start:4611 stop:5177 length:567 start_codon:yes stop_codon:yes gene_type:complete
MASDLSLIVKIQEDHDEPSLLELINRHSGIYANMVDKYTGQKSLLDKSTFLGDKDLEIYKAALNYDPTRKTKFSTYLANETKWKCLNAINYLKRKNETPLEACHCDQMRTEDFISTIEKSEAWEIFNKVLNVESDERVRKLLDIRYNTDNNKLIPWRVVSKKLGLSIQGCINLHTKFINKVKKEINYV